MLFPVLLLLLPTTPSWLLLVLLLLPLSGVADGGAMVVAGKAVPPVL
jgi:hypothetical protein